MRIGIGITTKNRAELLTDLLESIVTYTDMSNVKLYIADDSIDNKGVSYKKNECLRELKDCEHIFLLDDDLRIFKKGWVDFFINSGKEHLLFLNSKFHNFVKTENNVDIYSMCGGVFMYMTKAAIDRVGAFNEKFSPYGFEHAEYSNRIYGKKNYYEMLKGTDNYLFANDYSTPNFKSSITDSEKEIHVKNNWNKYFNEPQQTYIPL